MATYQLSVTEAVNACDIVRHRITANQKKIDDAKHRIQVEEASFLLSKQPLDKDKGYNYYLRERDNAEKAGDISCKEIDAKIEALERKKEAAIREIDAKIEALERKKELERENSKERAEKHHKNLEGIINKYDSMKPTSVIYSRLTAHVEELEKERVVLEDEMLKASQEVVLANERHMKRKMQEIEQQERQRRREEAIKLSEEIRLYEMQQAAIRREEEERAKRRMEEDNRRFREEQSKKEEQARPAPKHEELAETIEEDPMADFLSARKDRWDGWWRNSLYSYEMYLEDKKKCKQEKNGILVWKLSKWYEEEDAE
jgi:hypothetical protein